MLDVSLESMMSLLYFLYSDTFSSKNSENEKELLDLAKKYQVTRLQAVLEGLLKILGKFL